MQWQMQLLQPQEEYFPGEVQVEERHWRPWPEEEKHLHLAQLQQYWEQPAGKIQAVILSVH